MFLRLSLALLLVVPVAGHAQVAEAVAVQQALRDAEQRVVTVGHRLAVRNAASCPAPVPLAGWILGDTRLYGDAAKSAAKQVYDVRKSDALFIAALAPGGAAETSGARIGQTVRVKDAGTEPFARIEATETIVRRAAPDQPIAFVPDPPLATPLRLETGCATDWRVQAENGLSAAADGTRVFVSAAFVRYLIDDSELAALLAHEMAHNILRHRARLDAAGLQRGPRERFGRNARLIRATEREADRLSVWLLAGAGYDPRSAIAFRTRYGRAHGSGWPTRTHDRWQKRVSDMTAEIAALQSALQSDPAARPPLVDAPPPLE